jgi:oxygen-independent coproporphyrinogen-3 oxidase
MSGIYIHIPFCKQACHYCDFHFSTSLKSKTTLINYIIKEIELRKKEFPNNINSLYIGGGTPSLLTNNELSIIFNSLKKVIDITSLKEVTIEVNPEDINREKLNFLKEIGVNRLSIGVQSTNDKVLKWMNRIHDKQQVLLSLKLAKEYEFENFSIDFIYGTPPFLNRDYEKEISTLIEYLPTHISSYHLTIEKGTYFGHLEKKKELENIEDQKSEQEFLWLSKKLESSGYNHYEISNFSLEGKQSFHNSNYWKQLPYIGFGPGAHSFLKGKRRWNVSNNAQYIKKVGSKQSYFEDEKLSSLDLVNETIMLGLRTKEGFELDKIYGNLRRDKQKILNTKIQKLIAEDLLTLKENNIFMNKKKWLLSEYAARELFTV